MSDGRLHFGNRKYIALNLMIARWLGGIPQLEEPYCYITMGGTELNDVIYFSWASKGNVASVISYEQDPVRYKLAEQTAEILRQRGIDVNVLQSDIFKYRRDCDRPHVYFVDSLNSCSLSQYKQEYQLWFEEGVLQPGDFLMITSYLGRKPGWVKTLRPFEIEFNSLEIEDQDKQEKSYDILHPAFVLYRALRETYRDDLKIRCLGHIRYFDTSPMGLYGFLCEEGETEFLSLMNDIQWMDTVHNVWGDWDNYASYRTITPKVSRRSVER